MLVWHEIESRRNQLHVRRLYSSAHFNDSFPQHSDPEVLKTPLEGVTLLMKAIGIDKVTIMLHATYVQAVHESSCSPS